ncbi:MAG: LysM peptidoglycan-binding domain-containing protein, partial [Acidobacteria bacterium]|nr:LysM peptidoglycan-binding domain-containing protein [Acidobacteriota bacterium]
LNNLRDPNRISPGQHLRVDGQAARAVLASGAPSTYTVRRGDSLWIIARRYATTVDRIKRDNALRSNTLRPGQRLSLQHGSSGRTYVVRRGDTLGRIASRNRVSVSRLAQANGLSLQSTIYPGERLVIPQ